jgi:hypothetical protein
LRDFIACPKAVTTGQSIAVVRKYLDDNPEALHLQMGSLVLTALSEAFPCE